MRIASFALIAPILLGTGCLDQALQPLARLQVAPPPETVTFRIANYAPATGHQFKDLFVSNFSVKVQNAQLLLSTSRDGLPDALKTSLQATYGFVDNMPDSNSDGFSDLVVYLAGIQLAQQSSLYCPANLQQSSTNDAFVYNDARLAGSPLVVLGLRDCEKMYMGLNPKSFDYDQDGIPDYLELRCGLNPKNPNDVYLSPAADSNTNMDKCKRHIPIDESSTTQANKVFSYKYEIDLDPNTGIRTMTISNIPILNGGADNFVAFYVTEVDSNNIEYLYTAFTILKAGVAGSTLKFNYWGATQNQEITF